MDIDNKKQQQQQQRNQQHHSIRNAFLFGSCNSQQYENLLWPAMIHRNATAFIWTGDAIYGDDFYPKETMFAKRQVKQATPEKLQSLYNHVLDETGYQLLTKKNDKSSSSSFTVLGAIDDHDYGINNGDMYYQYKKESATLFVNFLKQSSNSNIDLSIMEQRAKNGYGIYGVKVFDFNKPTGYELLSDIEAGIEDIDYNNDQSTTTTTVLSNRTVAVFMLDCRSNKTPWKKPIGYFWKKYFIRDQYVDYTGDFLGNVQWEWLEKSIQRSNASINIIINGLQVHSDRYFDGNHVEDWSQFPLAQHKLYQIILNYSINKPTILVSGDVHMSELLRKDCRRVNNNNHNNQYRSILEVTMSGMTHSWCSNTCARPDSSYACKSKLFHYAMCIGMHWAHINNAWTDLIDIRTYNNKKISPTITDYNAKRRIQYILERNFGEIEFDWEQEQLLIRIFGKDNPRPLLSTSWDFNMLASPNSTFPNSQVKEYEYNNIKDRLITHGNDNVSENDWFCVNYRGDQTTYLKLYGFITSVSIASFILLLPTIFASTIIMYLLYTRFFARDRFLQEKSKKD